MKRACSHCQLEFNEEILKQQKKGEEILYFCCEGCERVYTFLHSQGLEEFYERLQENELSPVVENQESLSRFDSEGFMRKYVSKKNHLDEVSLILEHIHCIACVWLNEKILMRQAGIYDIKINYTNNKATILFDKNEISLSSIVMLIRSIGYDAHAYDPAMQEEYANKERRKYYVRMIVGVFCTMNIMWIAVAQYAGYFSGMSREIKAILDFASFLLCTPTLFFSGSIFWKGAYYAIKNRALSMDTLVVSGSTLAYLYSIYAAFVGLETYFESITMIITFVLIGKFLEQRGKKIAIDALDSLSASIPLQVNVLREGQKISISPEEVEVGEVIEALPAECIALDGELLSEYGSCDESALNGESLPIEKKKGDKILSGSIVVATPILYKTTKKLSHSLMSSIVNLVEESLNKRPKIQEQANALSRYFSSTILILATIGFVVWYISTQNVQESLSVAISVIIIACPCALALATPIASVVGLSEAIKRRILFREARFLETLAHANLLILDKTGTLTKGSLRVVKEMMLIPLEKEEEWALYDLLQHTHHPIAKGVQSFLENKISFCEQKLTNLEQKARGMVGYLGENRFVGGSLTLLQELGISYPQSLEQEPYSLFCFAKNSELKAIFLLEDTLKPEAKTCIESLQKSGLEIMIVSGDRFYPTQKVAQELNVKFYAEQTPLDKAEIVKKAHKEGKVVVMAGDGLNDALALAQSDIAIAMGNGVDVAIALGDVVLLDEHLSSLQKSFEISQSTFRLIKQNIFISLFYNACSIPLALCGMVIPVVAAASMSLSSLIVVGNSLRIQRKI
ncbi:heavy metal translocating P-type ATPase [Helicobacter monodelphidis]|uniref:heavy metal translocating P-type ATPase n=1 Tax=Helicobacter sp. 15-1451 TaxID=2004995 RepID=UPI0015EB924A|nr:heavy metal translocating P-type ATPase [Helicobacter sp. 15-1451]